jgi:hypothetical protein
MNSIPALDWRREGHDWIAWINDIESYTIKPVIYHNGTDGILQFELRLDNAATATSELVAVGYNPDDAEKHARAHLGDSEQ